MNCNFNEYCSEEGTCQKLTDKCSDEYNACLFGKGCFNNTCIPYFSLPDYTPVSSQEASFCASG